MKTAIIGLLISPLLLIAQQSGGAWTNIGPSPAAVDAFAVDQQGMGAVFMGTITGGVRKSVDHGITWSAANTGLTDRKTYYYRVTAYSSAGESASDTSIGGSGEVAGSIFGRYH